MKKSFRFLSAFLSAAMVFTTAGVSFAASDSPVTKDETVFVTLEADGGIREQTVSVWLHGDAGVKQIADHSSLSGIHDLKGSLTPQEQPDGSLLWDTGATDVYYQGTSSGMPPVLVEISYRLDGRELSPAEAIGASGHLELTVSLTNREYGTARIAGKERRVYTPFATVVGLTLSADCARNIRAEHGSVQTDSDANIVGFVCLPGMAETYDGLLTGKFDKLADYFFDSVTLEADVTDFELPTILVACAADASLFDDVEGLDDIGDLSADMDDLREATDELLDGSSDLLDGTDELLDGANDLDDGATDLRDGAKDIYDGADDLSDGLRDFIEGLNQISSNSKALNEGASQIADTILATANAQLQTALGCTDEQFAAYRLTWDNYADTLDGLLNVDDAMRAKARTQLKAALEKEAGGALDDDSLNVILYLTAVNAAGVTDSDSFEALLAEQAKKAQLVSVAAEKAKAASYTLPEDEEDFVSLVCAMLSAGGASQTAQKVQRVFEEAGEGDLENPESALYRLCGAVAAASSCEPEDAYGQLAALLEETTADELKNPAGEVFQQWAAISEGLGNPATAQEAYDVLCERIGESDAKNAIVIELACLLAQREERTAAETAEEVEDWLTEAGELAAEVSSAQEPAADGEEAAAMAGAIKALLTKAVLLTSGEQLTALSGLKDTLDQLARFTSGLKAYTTAVDSELTDGAWELRFGASRLKNGAGKLYDGTKDLKDGTVDLVDGAKKLNDGAKEMDDGLHEYDEDGIRKLTDSEDLYTLSDVIAVTDEVRAQAERYTGYSGGVEGVKNTVKFVMRTSAPVTEKENSVEVAEPLKQSWWESLWERVKALFQH